MVQRNPGLTIFCHIVLFLGAAAVCMPLYFAFIAGSLTTAEVQQTPFPWLPGRHFLDNVAAAWNEEDFSRLYINSIIVTVGIVVGKIIISLIAAFAVTYFRFAFRMTAFWLIFISLMLPVEVRIIPTYEAVADAAGPVRWFASAIGLSGLVESLTGYRLEAALQWNLVNTYGGLILPLIASASATFLFRQFFLTIPDELCEAARIDGAGPLKFFWDVLLPLSRANIAALSIILFLYGWNHYFRFAFRMTAFWLIFISLMLPVEVRIIPTYEAVADAAPAWNIAMAGAFFVMLPPAAIILLMQRWFTRGLVDSGK
jgi:sn-glycerol 3-phosphate transport system permease protein